MLTDWDLFPQAAQSSGDHPQAVSGDAPTTPREHTAGNPMAYTSPDMTSRRPSGMSCRDSVETPYRSSDLWGMWSSTSPLQSRKGEITVTEKPDLIYNTVSGEEK